VSDILVSEIGPHAIVPDWLITAPVGDRAVRLYAQLAVYAQGSWEAAMPARATLAKDLSCSVDTIDRAVKELEAAGAVTVKPRSKGKLNLANEYVLHVARGGRRGAATPGGNGAATRRGAARSKDLELERSSSSSEVLKSEEHAADAAPSEDLIGPAGLVGYFVDRAKEKSGKPPLRGATGRIGRDAKSLLEQGVSEETLKRALDVVVDKHLSPGAFPGVADGLNREAGAQAKVEEAVGGYTTA